MSSSRSWLVTLLAIAALVLVGGMRKSSENSATAPTNGKENRYVGAERCKMCHAAAEGGDQFGHWEKMQHAHAFETLSTPAALEAAKARGVADPATAPECLKCHETAFGVETAKVHPRFPKQKGVQCESCHGPGEAHFEARLRAASSKTPVPVAKDEIITHPTKETCLKCHNEESPSFKPFCYLCAAEKISHLDPRKGRTKEELEARKCKCPDPCTCKAAECGDTFQKNQE